MEKIKAFFNTQDKEKLAKVLVVLASVLLAITLLIIKPNITASPKSKITNLSSCSKLVSKESFIKVSGRAVSKEEGMGVTPFTFEVQNDCKEKSGYGIYVAVPKDVKNTEAIRFIVTKYGKKAIIKEGNLGTLNDMKDAFTKDELKQFKKNVKTEIGAIYQVFNSSVKNDGEYNLRVYVDSAFTKNGIKDTILGVGIKTYRIGE